jgi:hypothetical protein
LAEKSSSNDLIFREIEITYRRDATFKLPEPQNPVSRTKDNMDVTRDGTLGGKSEHHPTDGLLKVTRAENSASEQVKLPEYQTELVRLSATANSILKCFMPGDYSNPVT